MEKTFEQQLENLHDFTHNHIELMIKISKDSKRILQMLSVSEDMSEEELVSRARKIKPLVRIGKSGKKLAPGEVDENSKLVYVKPNNLYGSYLFAFEPDWIVRDENQKIIEAIGLKEVGRFICYHRYGGYCMFLRPGVDEVLQQLPEDVDIEQISAFEIVFNSDAMHDIYNNVIDRHVSMVSLYGIDGGLPEKVKKQVVVIEDKVYPYK